MRRVVCREFASLDHLSIEDVPEREPGTGEVVISVRAAGVNFVDSLIVQGRYQIKPPLPCTPGSEVSGEVLAVGEGVGGIAVGDRVLATTGFGAFAEQVVVPSTSVVPVPEGMTFGQSATFPQSYSTALYTLTRRAALVAGEWVLVLGGGGGIGLATVDVARALGAHVIAAASSEDKLAAARLAGAEGTIAYESEDLKVRARELSGGGVDVVVDPVGGAQAEPALRALRWGGRFMVVGFASGEIPRLPINQVLLNNRAVVGVDWGAWTFRNPQDQRQLLDEVLAMAAGGGLHPVEPVAYPLDHAAQALRDLEERKVTGKVILVP